MEQKIGGTGARQDHGQQPGSQTSIVGTHDDGQQEEEQVCSITEGHQVGRDKQPDAHRRGSETIPPEGGQDRTPGHSLEVKRLAWSVRHRSRRASVCHHKSLCRRCSSTGEAARSIPVVVVLRSPDANEYNEAISKKIPSAFLSTAIAFYGPRFCRNCEISHNPPSAQLHYPNLSCFAVRNIEQNEAELPTRGAHKLSNKLGTSSHCPSSGEQLSAMSNGYDNQVSCLRA